MNIVSICAVAVLTSVLSLTVKKHNSEIAMLVAVVGCIVILLSVFSSVSSVFGNISNLLNNAAINSNYISILLKSIGICFLTEFAIDCCKDAGQNALANNVSIAGKIMVLLTAMPLFEEILNFSVSLMKAA